MITGIIDRELGEGRFSFSNFYLRRIRRIAPAFLLVTTTTLIVGFVLLLPEDIVDLSWSAISSTLSAANIYYWKFLDTSYFADSSSKQPLLHMWSLGIEEQFYFLWPPTLYILFKLNYRKLIIPLLIFISISSFYLANQFLKTSPSFSYYMLPARAGELAIGAITFYFCARPSTLLFDRRLAEALALCGVALIIYSMLFISESDGFPGYNAILPCVGCALLILGGANHATLTKTLFSVYPVVFIGLLSYSLYLWHWPVMAFYRYFYGEITTDSAPLLVLIIVILSYASYTLVETPLRKARLPRFKIFLRFFVIPTLLIILIASIAISTDGLEDHISKNPAYSAALLKMDEFTKPSYKYKSACQSSKYTESSFHDDICIIGPGHDVPKMIVAGDSNATHYIGYLRTVAEHLDFRFRNVELSSCVPFPNNSENYVSPTKIEGCIQFNQKLLAEIHNYDVIFVSASWTYYQARSPSFEQDFR